jgi:hypothetical protein
MEFSFSFLSICNIATFSEILLRRGPHTKDFVPQPTIRSLTIHTEIEEYCHDSGGAGNNNGFAGEGRQHFTQNRSQLAGLQSITRKGNMALLTRTISTLPQIIAN